MVPRQTAALGEVSRVGSHWQVPTGEIGGSNPSGVAADFNITLCYTAFNTARLDVNLYGDSIHTEPLPQFQSSLESYTFNDIMIQLGNSDTKSGAANRGILQMGERDSWIPAIEDTRPGGVQSWVQGMTDMQSVAIVASKLINRYPSGNQSCVLDIEDLWYMATDMADADPSLVSLLTRSWLPTSPLQLACPRS